MELNTFDIMEYQPIFPELILAASALFLLMVGAFRGNSATQFIHGCAIAVCALVLYKVAMAPAEAHSLFQDMFISDAFTRMGKMLVLGGTILALLISTDWLMRAENQRFEFPIVVLLSTLGMLVMVSANDLISLYMGLELSSLALYVLASFQRDSQKSTEAGLKYFVLGALASGIMLFGASLVYGFAGTTSFPALAELLAPATPGNPGLLVGMVLLIVGFCFKISAVPFHMWTPDVYEGAPTPVTAFFAVAPKAAAILLLVRVLGYGFGDMASYWQQIIICISIASMLVGALGALRQANIKRLLAYSSIGHVGYILIGLAAGSPSGISAILIYLALYIFMSIGAFACVLMMKRGGEYVEDIGELAGLYHSRPHLALALAIFMFSMAGIPPLAGFFGKMYIFLAAVQMQLYGLAVAGVLASVVACYYYLKIIKLMFFDAPRAPFDQNTSASLRMVLVLCALVVFFFFLFPSPLVSYAKTSVMALSL